MQYDCIRIDKCRKSVDNLIICFIENLIICFIENVIICFIENVIICFIENVIICFIENLIILFYRKFDHLVLYRKDTYILIPQVYFWIWSYNV